MEVAEHVMPPPAREVQFATPDGATLTGLFYPTVAKPKAVVVLNGATGVPQHFYRAFARWAARERGVAVLTYDYRDTGLSAAAPVARSTADMVDWGIADQQAARAAARRAVPGAPIWIVGHSLGTMLLPNQEGFEDVTKVVGVASGFVHVSDHPWPYRGMALMFWYLLGPLFTGLMGYLPGKRIGFGADLPARAYWQWRRWCTSRGFYAADIGGRLRAAHWPEGRPDVRLLAMADDALIPPKCVARLARTFGTDEAGPEVIDPQQRGLRKVGHLGLFSRRNRVLWSDVLPVEG